jgi:hypothetical protein
MLGLLPLVATLLNPLPRQTVNVCAKPTEQVEAMLRQEAARVQSSWLNTAPNNPMFVPSVACSWRCDSGGSCTKNLTGFLRYTCRDRAFQLGLGAPDQEYHDVTHAKFGGKMFKVPDALIKASLDFPRSADFKKELARLGYKFVEFQSTSVTNFPHGFGRVLVLIEGEDYDQWYQIATADSRPTLLGRNVDMAVVEKRDEKTHGPLSPQNFYMNGYSRFVSPTLRWEQEGLGAPNPLNRCIMCHPSGLRGIFPVPGTVAKEEQETLRYVQKKIDATWTNAFGGFYENEKLGPPMGPVDPPGRPALVAKCAFNVPPSSHKKVARAMNCVSCHDGHYRGFINGGTDLGTINHKIVADVDEGRMPPEEPLTLPERAAVFNCLRMEYAEQLKGWLLERSCGTSQQAMTHR